MSSIPPLILPSSSPLINNIVIPDCCNLGVVFRVLVAVNLAVLVKTLLQAASVVAALLQFVVASIQVELCVFFSLLALCMVQRVAHHLSTWLQRCVCAFLPALAMLAVVKLLSGFEGLQTDATGLSLYSKMFIAALFGIVLQHYFELRTRAFSPALVEAKLQALQARIRPHFLFNSLNAVLSLIRTEPRRAETALEDLSELMRVLMRDARTMTTLEKEIRLCRQYLGIEKIRLGDRLKVKWERAGISNEVVYRAQIPTLLLQPLIENAVHYGVEPSAESSLIHIQLSHILDSIEIVIRNPYHLSGHEITTDGNQMALHNIRERLALLYDLEAGLSTQVVQGQFEVKVHFPYVKAKV